MAENSYAIEIKLASKNGWFTPDESLSYYGRYSRDYYVPHWWGGGEPASAHDNIVNYMNGQAAVGNKSVNYVLSDNKITLTVGPDNVAWCQESGNAVGISVEHQPTLGAEGYKKSGWLKDQLDQRYNKTLEIRGHNFWYQTLCPGTISLDRIAQEADKWKRGTYEQPAVPTPVPQPPTPQPSPQLIVVDDADREMFTLADAKLVNFGDLSVVKTFGLDTPMAVSQKIRYNNLEFYRTASAVKDNRLQGFLVGDLKDAKTPELRPEPPKPEWVANLRDIDDTTLWFRRNQKLIDITTGKPALNGKGQETVFSKDESFVSSAVTFVGGTEYRITDYSFKKGVFNGVPISSLTLTEPGVPNIPPVQNFEQRLSVLEVLVNKIIEFLTSRFGFKK